ncbi:MAG: hypothetical protein WBL44_09850 [Nitrososphaeraceae archaeon]|jgi:hypothetical protein
MQSNAKFLCIAFVIAGLIGFGTYGINNTTTQVLASHSAGDNMTGTAGMTNMTETEHAYNKSAHVVRDSVAELLEGRTIPAGQFIHLYDSTPYMITNGHVAVNVPCEDNSTASIQVLMGQAPNFTAAELENLPELSTPGEMCLYHVDIAPHEEVITDVAIANPGDSDLDFPPGSTAVIGINEIMPGAEEGEHGHGAEATNSTES